MSDAVTAARRSGARPRPRPRRRRRRRRRQHHPAQRRRSAHERQPVDVARAARPGPRRRAELLHRQVPHPAVPAADLPGRRRRVRRALGGARGDQRDRDRLRAQPERLLGRRAGLDAVHARHAGRQYGTDANRDGRKDPFNPVDAIFAAARYLRAAGADQDLRRAIFAYNHADWYVESVLMRARLIGGLPSDLVGSLNGLTQGHFPVYAKARYADDLAERAVRRRQGRDEERRAAGRVRADAPRDRHLRQRRRARDRRPGRHDHGDRPDAAARALRPAARRLRQHLHVRAAQEGRAGDPGAQAQRAAQGLRARHRSRCPPTTPPSSSGCSPTPAAATPTATAARARSPRPRRRWRRARRCAPTSPASTASTRPTSCSSG